MPTGARVIAALLCALVAAPAAAQTAPCGTPEGVCETALGSYRLALPEGARRPVPAVLFLHGWGDSAAGTMGNRAMLSRLAARGYALIAPQGIPQEPGGKNDWGVRDGSRHPRDDVAFIAQVLDDAARHGVDRNRVLAAGFSRGGSMVWDLACRAPGIARAFAPVSGAFWQPLPAGCAGPVSLYHSHGWSDRVVPLEGRTVAGGRLAQGDLFAGLAILRRADGCTDPPDEATVAPGIWIRRWTGCDAGGLVLMLHPGGHMIPDGWVRRSLDWFEALDRHAS